MESSHSKRKLATRRAAPRQTPQSEGGTLPAAPTVLNAFTSMPSKTQCSITVARAPNSTNMKFGHLNEELEKWEKDLLDSERNFVDMVAQLNATDRMIFQNISRLECLHLDLIQFGQSQADVCSDLSRIGGELLMVEEAVNNMETLIEPIQPCRADEAMSQFLITKYTHCCSVTSDSRHEHLRGNLYNFMIQINADLHNSNERLSNIIQAVNYPSNAPLGSDTSPVHQIGRVLNYHYECLVDLEDAHLKCKTVLENIQKIQSQIMASSLDDKC